MTVTATRTEHRVSEVPMPVSVIGRLSLRQLGANSASDVFRDLPGLDVTGVGTTQVRPVIRGQRGQRVLLMGDGLRLNNARRQQDFGEIPALYDLSSIERVEIVRGPGSVLYGSDAIGGVVNLITVPPMRAGLHGSAGYRYSSHDKQQNVRGMVEGRFGRWSFRGRGSFRNTDPYSAPGGAFGDISLGGPTRVHDTGVEDRSAEGFVGYEIATGHDVALKFQRYSADSTGFGFVDPDAYNPGAPDILIQYPRQRFSRVVTEYSGAAVPLTVADVVDAKAYWQSNTRDLSIDVLVPLGGAPGPDSVQSVQRNFTDLKTVGGRLELKKFIGDRLVLTYGGDYYRDRSENVDTAFATTYLAVPGPVADTNPVSPVPDATYQSGGGFAQGEVALGRATVVVGARYQWTRSETNPVAGAPQSPNTASDHALVGSVNALVEVAQGVQVIGTVGRGFRSPNLIERFFEGVTAEGFGFRLANVDLEPETSLNVDLGTRLDRGILSAEVFLFQNTISDAIVIEATGDTNAASGLAEYRNVNLDKLRVRGVEAHLDVQLPAGFSIGGNYTHLDSKNITQNQNNPTGDGFSNQLVGILRYIGWHGRVFGEYRLRHNFERKDAELTVGNPVGATLPAFTTHAVRAGVLLNQGARLTHRLTAGVTNISNALYAEFSNINFFRPNPGRSLVVSYDLGF